MTSLKQMPSAFMNTLILYVKCFRFVGLDFFENTKTFSLNNLKFIVSYVNVLMLFTTQVIFIFKTEEVDFLAIANAIPCAMIFGQNVVKISVFRKKHDIRRIIEDIAELWPCELENEEKISIMDIWIRRVKTFTETIFKLSIVGVLVFVWTPLLVTFATSLSGEISYFYPFELYHPFEIKSLWVYTAVYIYEATAASIGHLCIYQGCDLLLLTMTVDICILLRLLQYDLQNIRVTGVDERRRRDPAQDEQCYQELKRIVRTHQKLLRLSDALNDKFGTINFVAVFSCSIIFCFFGFLLVVSDMDIQTLQYLIAVVEILFVIFCVTLPGQILSNTSLGVSSAAYDSLWYQSDLRFRKIIFFMIARSQKPCQLSALGYADMNFNTFSKICSTGWSYLSLLNQMYSRAQR